MDAPPLNDAVAVPCSDARSARGCIAIRRWLDERPTIPEDVAAFVPTSILAAQLARLIFDADGQLSPGRPLARIADWKQKPGRLAARSLGVSSGAKIARGGKDRCVLVSWALWTKIVGRKFVGG